MILNKIKLEDFVSHKNTELDLGLGINVVVGPNGAGKTSILDGISFALFNDTDRGKKENLINSRARRFKVSLAFTEGGIPYDVEWSLERRGSAHGSFFRTVDGKRVLLARDGERSVAPEIQKVLGIDKSMFLQSIYVRQGEIEQLVTAKPAERKTLISRLLGVEDLDKAWSSIKDVIEVYRDKHIVLESELKRKPEFERQRDEAEARSREVGLLLEAKGRELSELESGLGALQATLDGLEAKMKDFDRFERERGILQQRIIGLEKKLETEKTELEKASAAAEIVDKLKDDVEKLPFLDSYVTGLLEKEKLELKLSGLREKLEEIAKAGKIVEQNEESHRRYLEKERLLTEKSQQRKEYEGCPKAIETAKKQLEKCEKEQKKKREGLAKELDKCSDALGEPVTIGDLAGVLERVSTNVQERAREVDKKINEVNGALGVLNQREKDLAENLLKFSSEVDVKACPTCDTELPPERVSQLVRKFSLEKEAGKKEKVALKSALEEAEHEKDQLSDKRKQIDALDPDRLRIMEVELNEVVAEIASDRLEIENLGKQIEALSAIDQELELLESEKTSLESANKEFELAGLRLSQLPSKEEIEEERKPLLSGLQEIAAQIQLSEGKLGYVPADPQDELAQLGKKKEEYDQNIQIAGRQSEYKSNVASTAEELEGSRSECSGVTSGISKLGYNEALHDAKREELKRVTEDVKKLSVEIAGKEQAKTGADEEARRCRGELKALEAKAAEKKLVTKYISVLNDIRDAFGKDGIQKIIRARAKPVLEKATRDLFERFNLAYSDVRIDDDYNISVIGSSGEQDIDQISGGERVALAIALRLAIAQVLSGKIETVIMDEPTTHLDEERRKELVNILNSFFREGGRIIPQMLIITHHSEIEEVADVVYSVRKKEGYSIVESGKLLSSVPL